ncbi:unnamed protein product, partial [Discosporangium mesarthrocarpum]
MLERFMTSMLTRVLGEYVEGGTFSRESVHVGVWSGRVVLENMRIKKDLLDRLELPLALKHGIIGRLELCIPWSNLGKAPFLVVIDRVFLVVEPKYEWDKKAVKRREQAVKRAKIASAEMFRLSSQLVGDQDEAAGVGGGGGPANSGGSKWGSSMHRRVTEYLVTKLVDSAQVHICEVHLRYEDRISHRGTPMYVGVTLGSIHVQSAKTGWEPSGTVSAFPFKAGGEGNHHNLEAGLLG